MKNLYLELKEQHQKEVNDFPTFFAFDNKQFEKGMEKLGLQKDDTDKIVSIGGGGYIKLADVEKWNNIFNSYEEKKLLAMNDEKTGQQYIVDMFVYELNNHEYSYTRDISDTLDALGLTGEQINNDERLRVGLAQAIDEIDKSLEEMEMNEPEMP